MAHSQFCCRVVIAGLLATAAACSSDKDKDESTDAAMSDDAQTASNGDKGVDDLPALPDDVVLPIVFVHGFAGSAQQYQSQAMRFAANGYPADHILAYEHDGAGFNTASFVPGVDETVDKALADFDAEQVFLVGHSRGTIVSTTYLADATRAAKVAKYISLDGAGCANIPVPCIEPNQAMFPGQKHVEVATSAESFVMQYEFLFDETPKVVDIVRQASPVVISGRAVNFPANTGRDSTTLTIWKIDAQTAERMGDKPLKTFDLGSNGDFGPVTVDPDQFYELTLSSSESDTEQHFYPQRFLRSSQFVRLLSGPPDAESRLNSNLGDDHSAVIAMRMREWMPEDILNISTASESGDEDEVNVITDNLSASAMYPPIALHLHDGVDTPGESSLDVLPWFGDQPFQNGLDVYMPASDPPDGTITVTNMPRGDESRPQTLHARNWASSHHTIMLLFSDFAQD